MPCDLTGRWTASTSPFDMAPGLIAIKHNVSAGTMSVTAAVWGDEEAHGTVDGQNVSLLMPGANHTANGTIHASAFHDFAPNASVPAPDCTALSFGWNKFPFTPMPVPAVPSCAHAQDGSCPPPPWPAVWDMNLSTALQPRNTSGYYRSGGQYGLCSFDWSNAGDVWRSNPDNATNCSQVLVEQARRVKAENPRTRVLVYRNMLLALEWIRGQRAAMYDASKAGFFLQYQPGNPSGTPAGTIYDEPSGTLKQYIWNYSNPEVVAHWIREVTGPDAVGSPYVDGVFTDDVDGTFQEHVAACENMGLSPKQVAAVAADTQTAYGKILAALMAHNGYNWQAFGSEDFTAKLLPSKVIRLGMRASAPLPYHSPTTLLAPALCALSWLELNCQAEGCAKQMRKICAAAYRAQPRVVAGCGPNWDDLTCENGTDKAIAAFLIARGPFWWYGWGWEGVHEDEPRPYDPLWSISPGAPTSDCAEISPGVFERQFEKGRAALDCNLYEATLDFVF